MDEAVYRRDCHGLIREYLIPCAEGLIGGNRYAFVFIPACNQLEQDACFGLILMRVGDIIKNDQIELVAFGQSIFQGEFLPCDLQLLHEIARPAVKYAISRLNQGMSNCTQDMGFPCPGVSNRNEISSALNSVAACQRFNARLRQTWHRFKLVGCQGLAA